MRETERESCELCFEFIVSVREGVCYDETRSQNSLRYLSKANSPIAVNW